jgi:hypothetical protein
MNWVKGIARTLPFFPKQQISNRRTSNAVALHSYTIVFLFLSPIFQPRVSQTNLSNPTIALIEFPLPLWLPFLANGLFAAAAAAFFLTPTGLPLPNNPTS